MNAFCPQPDQLLEAANGVDVGTDQLKLSCGGRSDHAQVFQFRSKLAGAPDSLRWDEPLTFRTAGGRLYEITSDASGLRAHIAFHLDGLEEELSAAVSRVDVEPGLALDQPVKLLQSVQYRRFRTLRSCESWYLALAVVDVAQSFVRRSRLRFRLRCFGRGRRGCRYCSEPSHLAQIAARV